jgi:hypothetical protein
MNRKPWQDREGHPPAGLLLLHLDDELEVGTADAVRLHLIGCAACREECEQIERGISRFIAFRDAVEVPAPAPRPAALRERLLGTETGRSSMPVLVRLRGLIRLNPPRPVAFALGSAFLCMVVWLWLFLGAPRQSVYASQILDDARNASDSLIAHSKVLNQKIRLRRGSLVIERSIRHGRQSSLQARESSIDLQLQQDLDLAHINLNDPLSANDFADWRSGQQGHTDSVKETSLDVTITTRVARGAITEGSLTLSRPGWRPIARSVEFRGQAPIEISEEGYDITDSPSVMPESTIGSLAPGSTSAINAPAAAAEVSAAELEVSELDLREALHSIGADVSASPEIWRSESTVFFNVLPESPKQKAAIGDAASRIPHVREAGKQFAPSAEASSAKTSGPYTTTPPLAAALEAEFGDAQAAGNFLDSLRTRSSRVLAEAAALDQLGKRYPADAIKALPPDLRARVNRLAASMLSSLQHDSADYVKLLSPTLDQMAHELNIAVSSEVNRNLPGCLAWQQNAALAEPQLRNLANDVSLLFVPNHTEKPVAPKADALLAESLATRSFLELHLMSTCQLFAAD